MTLPLRAIRRGDVSLRVWGSEASSADVWTPLATDTLAVVASAPSTLSWDERHPALGLCPLTLLDHTPYLLSLPPGATLPPALEAPRVAVDREGHALHALTLRGHAGRLRLEVRGARPVSLDAEVCLRRAGATDDWRAMLDDLCRADLALAAHPSAITETGLDVAPNARARTATETLLLLDHLVRSGTLRDALEHIARDPITAVATRATLVPLDRASRLHPDELAARGAQAHALAREHGPSLTRDVPESRFVAACLADFAAHARALASTASPLTDQALRTLAAAVSSSLDALVADARRGPLAGVRDAGGERAVTVALQRRRGYREVFAAWQRLRASPHPQPLVGDETVGLADAPRLYERWCALKLATAVGADEGAAAAFAAGGCVVRVAVAGRDVTLASQGGGRSYSLAFRPDFTVTCGGRALVFDAKYRVDEAAEGRAPRDAVVKMHAYRDAIDGVRAAWALFPGAVSEAWDAPGGGGVGSVALRPGGGGEAALAARVTQFLRGIDGPGEGINSSR